MLNPAFMQVHGQAGESPGLQGPVPLRQRRGVDGYAVGCCRGGQIAPNHVIDRHPPPRPPEPAADRDCRRIEPERRRRRDPGRRNLHDACRSPVAPFDYRVSLLIEKEECNEFDNDNG